MRLGKLIAVKNIVDVPKIEITEETVATMQAAKLVEAG